MHTPTDMDYFSWAARRWGGGVGRVTQSIRPFCGTVFLRIAVAEFGEVFPMACMSSEVSLCLVSGADGF